MADREYIVSVGMRPITVFQVGPLAAMFVYEVWIDGHLYSTETQIIDLPPDDDGGGGQELPPAA